MHYKLVFWDWNGTLFNDTVLCHEITNDLLKEIGKESITYDFYRKNLRHPIREFYNEIMQGDISATYEWFSEKFHDLYEEKRYTCKVHDHVEESIAYFKSKNVSQSILSAHPQYLLDAIIKHLNIAHHFDHIVGATDKLATDKFKEADKLMKLHSTDPRQTLMIGDTNHDAEVADRLGIDCIILAQGMQCKTKLTHLKYPILDSMKDLLGFLTSPRE